MPITHLVDAARQVSLVANGMLAVSGSQLQLALRRLRNSEDRVTLDYIESALVLIEGSQELMVANLQRLLAQERYAAHEVAKIA